jgi:4-amino-4-deoxy-L-arabinose transferase-like glycosyltransferase
LKINQSSNLNNNSKLINFLEANKPNEKYLVAMAAASTIAPELILQTGQPVMSYGGFGGGDRIITLNKFKELVKSGALRYVIVDKNNGGNIEIRNWITHHGKIVPKSKWQENENSEVKNQRGTYDKNHKKVQNKVMNSSRYNNAIYLYDLHGYEKYI